MFWGLLPSVTYVFNFLQYVCLETLYYTCSYFNIQEIEVVMRYVERLLADRFRGRKILQEDIGIITPYRKQVRSLLLAVTVFTLILKTCFLPCFTGVEIFFNVYNKYYFNLVSF